MVSNARRGKGAAPGHRDRAQGRNTAEYAVRVVPDNGKPRFRATLHGDDPKPRAGVPWHFTLRAFDGADNPVSGTAILRVVANGRIVDTLGWFRFNGLLGRTYRWPSALRGSSALLQATVVGPGGTRAAAAAVLASLSTGDLAERGAA